MYKFAHMADFHIGAWRDLRLRELNLQSFETCIDRALQEHVDFMIFAGDIFHVNLPDLESVRRVVVKLREVRESGVGIYAVYGSHDYSPNATSMIDILTGSGLITKVVEAEADEETVKLRYIADERTGAKICGMSGRSYALERRYFEALDRASLEEEQGFRIFVFHSSVEEVKPAAYAFMQGIPASYLPQGLDYYAGGHIHRKIVQRLPEVGLIAYPGPPFGATFTDLEDTARGERRGFLMVEFEDEVRDVRFVDNQLKEVVFREIDGENKTANEVASELDSVCSEIDAAGKIVLLRLRGTLSAGGVNDIDFGSARQLLKDRGAEFIFINRRVLTTRRPQRSLVPSASPAEIEERVLHESLAEFKVDPSLHEDVRGWVASNLTGDNATTFAKRLLKALKTEKQEGETKASFEERLLKETLALLPRWEQP